MRWNETRRAAAISGKTTRHPTGEALRNDEDFSHIAAWEYKGQDRVPVQHREPLMFEFVTPTQRSYE